MFEKAANTEDNDTLDNNKNSANSDQNSESLGLVQVYTGTGKGKTTAALGLGLRALGKGLKIFMIQFMKGDIDYGEIIATKKLDGFVIEQFGRPDFVNKENPEKIDFEFAQKALRRVHEIISENKYNIVILDEINVALDYKLITLDDVIDLIKNKPKNIELVLTGRYAHPKIIELADLVTNMEEVKHPYQAGIPARNGIEH